MWGAQEVRRILAYRDPVDLRKSFTGLAGLVKGVLAEDPLSGTVFVFVNRRGTLLKRIFWDRTGSCLFAKVTDGYKVYDRFVQSVQAIVHAQCWSHARRRFVEAQPAEPALVAQALEFIGSLYAHEARTRERDRTASKGLTQLAGLGDSAEDGNMF